MQFLFTSFFFFCFETPKKEKTVRKQTKNLAINWSNDLSFFFSVSKSMFFSRS